MQRSAALLPRRTSFLSFYLSLHFIPRRNLRHGIRLLVADREDHQFAVLRIDEQLYGCEELPEGQPVCCDVLLEDAAGQRRVLAYPDAELTRLGINEGDAVRLEHHTLTKC